MIGWLWPDSSTTFGCRRAIYQGLLAGAAQAVAWSYAVVAGDGAVRVTPAVAPALAVAAAVLVASASLWLWRRPNAAAAAVVLAGAVAMAAGLGTVAAGWAWLAAVALAVNGLRGAVGWRRMKRVDPDVEL